jgi:hypothetical protein
MLNKRESKIKQDHRFTWGIKVNSTSNFFVKLISLGVSICLDDWENLDNIDKNLDADKSRLKSLDFKNLNQEIKYFGLDTMNNLDRFQKLISTDQEISISIGLDCWDPQA